MSSSPSITAQLTGLISLIRPRQWVKNAFVLVPLIFSGLFIDPGLVRESLIAMLMFCVASSVTYVINDYHDIEHDRKHPTKSKTRPLASGQVTKRQALALVGAMLIILLWGYTRQPNVLNVILGYLALNFLYSAFLKHQPVVDIFTIAIGFVLRIYAGAIAVAVSVSSWMFVTSLCLALYLAAIKRRQELCQSGAQSRKVLAHYTVALVERYAEMAATGALLFYSLFVMTTRPELIVSIPLVLFGLFRYWFLVESLDKGESPTDALISDWQLLLTIFTWGGLCVWALWPDGT